MIRSSHLANELEGLGAEVLVATSAHHSGLIPAWMKCPRAEIEGMDYLRSKNPVVETDFSPDVFVLDVMFPRDDWLCAPKNVLIVGAGWSITEKIAEAADLLVFQTGWTVKAERSISGPKHLMLGPRYRGRPLGKTQQVMISFGAGIPRDYEEAAREAFPGALVPEGGEMLCGLQYRSRVHVGSMGMSSYESMALGCVPIVVSRSTDHEDTARKLQRLGVLVSCGILADCPPQSMVKIVQDVLLEGTLADKMSEAGMALVDGKGLGRVARRILSV
jgi:hypothetical protein